ncbi:hypothetical protein HYH03_009631 [Edaphochlamys debaryana]|uniref:FAD dependent oxidoreductase domain-containing protein n=1 Tax=Edaphochlamys debaryana TaxID=47281 RepID=A0A835Y423_9CHLO|nr:hypothetical protein HYH03_009631 [Edaphochlamys debaryana]|eukprot:KAG2492140.1 hypothetical protein HYH03_009631 [Edaphochlamys debaryana]
MGPTALRTTLRCGTGGLASWAFPAAATEAAGRGAAAGARAATGHLPHHSLPAAAVRAASTAAQGGLGSGSRTGASDGGGSGSRAATAYDPGKSYDAVVVGLGAYGSAALYHLARRGLKVLGIERHASIGHTYGSSHGATRITRLAYFEGPQYYGLIKRSLALFMDLEAELGARAAAGGQPAPPPLFQRTGMLDIGSVFERSLESARAHGLQHEVLTGAELNRRFPAYRVPGEWRALLQPDGGVLAPERIMQAQVAFAQEAGAEVALGEGVASWRAGGGGGGGVEVTTTSGRRVVAGAAVLAAGPWMGCLVPELQELCVPERQVVGWFDIEVPSRPLFAPDRFPVFLIEETPGGDAYYGFPEQADRPGLLV